MSGQQTSSIFGISKVHPASLWWSDPPPHGPLCSRIQWQYCSPKGLNVPIDLKKPPTFRTWDMYLHMARPHLICSLYHPHNQAFHLGPHLMGRWVQSFVQVSRQPSSSLQSILAAKLGAFFHSNMCLGETRWSSPFPPWSNPLDTSNRCAHAKHGHTCLRNIHKTIIHTQTCC